MRHETIKNDFFTEKVPGPEVGITINKLVEVAAGNRVFFTKRMAPAGTICNGRIYCVKDGEAYFVHSSDLNIFDICRRLESLAREFNVEFLVFHEHGSNYYWSSKMPEMWLGGHVNSDGNWSEEPVPLREVKAQMEEHTKQQQRQWLLDHGLLRRTFKEYRKDLMYRYSRYGRVSWKDITKYSIPTHGLLKTSYLVMKHYLGLK